MDPVTAHGVNPPATLKDLTWGGRVRTKYQYAVWDIAQQVARSTDHSIRGSMLSSSETFALYFLDGGVSETHGYFGSSSGMHLFGRKAVAYILYRLGVDPRRLMRDRKIPDLAALEEELRKVR